MEKHSPSLGRQEIQTRNHVKILPHNYQVVKDCRIKNTCNDNGPEYEYSCTANGDSIDSFWEELCNMYQRLTRQCQVKKKKEKKYLKK